MWIVITLLATVLQIARTSEQHRLKTVLNPIEAGYVRFVYAFPIALLLGSMWMAGPGKLSAVDVTFWLYAGGASVSQILATVALLKSFRIRNFAIGTLYAKTEVLFVGVASTVLLGEALKPLAWLGGTICLAGVVLLLTGRSSNTVSSRPIGSARRVHTELLTVSDVGAALQKKIKRFRRVGEVDHTSLRLDRAALFGLLAGVGFALASVALRGASSSLSGVAFDRAALTLTVMLGIQTFIQGTYVGLSSKTSLKRVAGVWRQALGVAVLSLAGSMAWAVAMTLENAAKVRTLGQIEIIFAFILGVLIHREKHQQKEYLASVVVLIGIVLYIVA